MTITEKYIQVGLDKLSETVWNNYPLHIPSEKNTICEIKAQLEPPHRQTTWHGAQYSVHTLQINTGPDPRCASNQKVNILLSTPGETLAERERRWKSSGCRESHPEPILLSPVTIIVCYCYWILCQLSVYSCAFASEDLFIASGITGFILCFF